MTPSGDSIEVDGRRQVRKNLAIIHLNFEVSYVLNTYVRNEICQFFKMLLDLLLNLILKYGWEKLNVAAMLDDEMFERILSDVIFTDLTSTQK